jgi:hypothetical protein
MDRDSLSFKMSASAGVLAKRDPKVMVAHNCRPGGWALRGLLLPRLSRDRLQRQFHPDERKLEVHDRAWGFEVVGEVEVDRRAAFCGRRCPACSPPFPSQRSRTGAYSNRLASRRANRRRRSRASPASGVVGTSFRLAWSRHSSLGWRAKFKSASQRLASCFSPRGHQPRAASQLCCEQASEWTC